MASVCDDPFEAGNIGLSYLLYLENGFETFIDKGERLAVEAGTELYEPGTAVECCYLLIEGRAICYDITENGMQRIYNIFEPNSLMLEECLLFGWVCQVRFKVMRRSVLIKLDRCALVRTFKRDIDATLEFSKYQSMKFISSRELLRLGQHKSAEWQVCRLLQSFMEKYGVDYDGKILIKEHLTQQMIGDILGINRVTITRIFKNLKGEFLERVNDYYCIRSREQLEQYLETLL